MHKKMLTLLSCLFLLSSWCLAQIKGEWYTYTTGNGPIAQLTISEKNISLSNQDIGFRPLRNYNSANARTDNEEKITVIKDFNTKGKTYLVHVSYDSLFFCTSFRYDKSNKILWMYCADGTDNGYKSLNELQDAIKKDTGSHFAIALYRKDDMEKQLSLKSITSINKEIFSTALQSFNTSMDQFWQYRGYGRYEPFHSWMNLIFGNAWANAFPDTFNKQSLTPKNINALIRKYEKDPDVRKLLIAAGLIQE